MALSDKTQYALHVALGKAHGEEVAAAVASGSAPAAVVTAIGTTSNLTSSAVAHLGDQTDLVGVDGTGSNAAPLAAVQTQIDAIQVKLDATIDAVNAAPIMTGAEARLDAIEAKVDAILVSLKAAALMASS